MAIHAIIQGQLMGAQVDQVPDPLLSGLRPGVVVAWREYGLRRQQTDDGSPYTSIWVYPYESSHF
jgi:hypothetical protein